MTDWYIISEDKDFSDFPADEPQPSHHSSLWRWSLLIGGMIVTVLIFGFFTIQERQQGQVATREELTAFIKYEESLRLSGNRTQAEALIASDAPQAWRNTYWNNFEDDNLPATSGDIHVNQVEFEGRCAVVEIDIYENTQVRTYCLNDQSWQRAPLPNGAWGYGQTSINFPNGSSLYFFPRDQVFAKALASDLLIFFEAVSAISGNKTVYNGLEIAIEPHDLHAPLILDDGLRVIVNSPKLLPIKREATRNSNEATIRYVMAKALLRRIYPDSTKLPSDLPGVVRFLNAAQTIGALHLMPHLESWEASPDERGLTRFSPYSPRQRDMFYLMADNIYRQCGLGALINIVQQLPTTSSWGDIFKHPFNQSLLILDNKANSDGVQIVNGRSSTFRDNCSIAPDKE